MDDRFKFRGKRIDNGIWIIGDYCRIDNDYYIRVIKRRLVERYTNLYENVFEDYNVIPETIGQYTGIKDCNKKLIFEGDTFEKGGNIFKIEWYDGGFIIQGKNDFQVLNQNNVDYYEIVITGNIHEDNK